MTAYSWLCVCGTTGTGEAAAQRHAKVCGRFGWPWTNPEYALTDGEWRIGPRRVLVWIPLPITDEEARAAHARCQRARQMGTMADLDPRTLKAERAYQRRKKRAKAARRTA